MRSRRLHTSQGISPRGIYEGKPWKQENPGAINFRTRRACSGFAITCSECGNAATVPFKPNPNRPVYCPGCNRERKRRCRR